MSIQLPGSQVMTLISGETPGILQNRPSTGANGHRKYLQA